mmetsp:Transcript_26674/g.58641  ORF Transcript_26674/g.58641 Transcript_26674/m.58641 type:complete len:347 (-) Transcript_26674:71-1111(-)
MTLTGSQCSRGQRSLLLGGQPSRHPIAASPFFFSSFRGALLVLVAGSQLQRAGGSLLDKSPAFGVDADHSELGQRQAFAEPDSQAMRPPPLARPVRLVQTITLKGKHVDKDAEEGPLHRLNQTQWKIFTFVSGSLTGGASVLLFASLLRFLNKYPSGRSSGKASKPIIKRIVSDHTEDFESLQSFWPRCTVLGVVLLLQSLSSLIVNHYMELLTSFPSLLYFLTMLVGVGGNVGGQSMILAVRQLALGEEVSVMEQLWMGIKLGGLLGPLGYIRANTMSNTAHMVCTTVAVSILFIAASGAFLGAFLPKLLNAIYVDPGHSAVLVSVITDILGLFIVCFVGHHLMT